jgi:acetylglutamate kinase
MKTNQKPRLTVVKVGGAVVEDAEALDRLLDQVALITTPVVFVHGGGRSASAMARRLGIEPVMIEGRRVTDAAMLEIVTMVYGGLVNKNIVARLQARQVNAIGLTGADMNVILSDVRPKTPIDYGFVGDVKRVNDKALTTLLNAGMTPVVAPLTHDGAGTMLNTNADTMAMSVASALADTFDVTLTFCFEMNGVMRDPDDADSVIPTITPSLYETLKADGVVSGGMIPKLDNAFKAINSGVSRVVITKADNLSDETKGTKIIGE